MSFVRVPSAKATTSVPPLVPSVPVSEALLLVSCLCACELVRRRCRRRRKQKADLPLAEYSEEEEEAAAAQEEKHMLIVRSHSTEEAQRCRTPPKLLQGLHRPLDLPRTPAAI